jgi:hypothetical protein
MSEEINLSQLKEDKRASIQSRLASCRLPSFPAEICLVASFDGVIENSSSHESGYPYMHAMIGDGFAACNPATLIVDLRGLKYESGDEMCRIFDQKVVTKMVVSDANREGLTRMIAGTFFLEPSTELFDSVENALKACDSAYRKFLSDGRKKIIAADF